MAGEWLSGGSGPGFGGAGFHAFSAEGAPLRRLSRTDTRSDGVESCTTGLMNLYLNGCLTSRTVLSYCASLYETRRKKSILAPSIRKNNGWSGS